jgi:DNA-binding CsgD family transcriptional regulator
LHTKFCNCYKIIYKEIGASLNISANTAKKHVMNIYQKLHVNSRTQALHLAYEKGYYKFPVGT